MDTKRQPCPFRFGLTSRATPCHLHALCGVTPAAYAAEPAPAQPRNARLCHPQIGLPSAGAIRTSAALASSHRTTMIACCSAAAGTRSEGPWVWAGASGAIGMARHPGDGGWPRRVWLVPLPHQALAPPRWPPRPRHPMEPARAAQPSLRLHSTGMCRPPVLPAAPARAP